MLHRTDDHSKGYIIVMSILIDHDNLPSWQLNMQSKCGETIGSTAPLFPTQTYQPPMKTSLDMGPISPWILGGIPGYDSMVMATLLCCIN